MGRYSRKKNTLGSERERERERETKRDSKRERECPMSLEEKKDERDEKQEGVQALCSMRPPKSYEDPQPFLPEALQLLAQESFWKASVPEQHDLPRPEKACTSNPICFIM